MATRELISLNGKQRFGINISDTVGAGGRNRTGDVLAIQAMFNYIEMGLGREAITPFGISLPNTIFETPELTGILDAPTMNTIFHFQLTNSSKLLSADGIIHPASYKGRNINHFKRIMTITLLHVYALAARRKLGDSDYTLGMARLAPKLVPFLVNQLARPASAG